MDLAYFLVLLPAAAVLSACPPDGVSDLVLVDNMYYYMGTDGNRFVCLAQCVSIQLHAPKKKLPPKVKCLLLPRPFRFISDSQSYCQSVEATMELADVNPPERFASLRNYVIGN